ncbi:glycosyl-4,4'-diaponeurosporenoate acyltransferase [Rossellomorea sp. NPDC077527]|uniref:glycosyl-4,4'-diaponeurosporenoate acyltransferase CrtO family protein n=1 Tax=Rossellomorea sp. NPDC077527 TaxID=3364510 RepID=UPI0037C81D29
MTSRFSPAFLQKFSFIFRPQTYELDGPFYARLKIRKWKAYLPDAGGWFRSGMKKNQIGLSSDSGRETFLRELDRAELSHWLQMLPAPLFFIQNNGMLSWVMISYGIFFNLPLILVQRYNRIRILRVIKHSVSSKNQEVPLHSKTPHF